MRRSLPPLTSLPAFEATARLGSVTLAARELGRTHGAVSKQIHHLADSLGVELFEKEGTGLRLTEHGRRFLPHVTEALDALDRGMDDARAEAGRRSLVVGASGTFASRWLMPRMPRFAARAPDVEVDFRMAGRSPVPETACDMVVSWDRLRSDSKIKENYVPIGDVQFGLIHAPGYPVEIEGTTCALGTRCVTDMSPEAWWRWSRMSGIRVTAPRTRVYPHTALMLEAVAAGLGAAITERRLVEEELDEGRLVAPFGWAVMGGGFGAFMNPRGRTNSAARDFIDWLKTEA